MIDVREINKCYLHQLKQYQKYKIYNFSSINLKHFLALLYTSFILHSNSNTDSKIITS